VATAGRLAARRAEGQDEREGASQEEGRATRGQPAIATAGTYGAASRSDLKRAPEEATLGSSCSCWQTHRIPTAPMLMLMLLRMLRRALEASWLASTGAVPQLRAMQRRVAKASVQMRGGAARSEEDRIEEEWVGWWLEINDQRFGLWQEELKAGNI
jgi:hypothetical protein